MITREEIFLGRSEPICLLKWKMDFALFCEEVLKYTIKGFHKEWCETLQREQRIAISAPTSYGKSYIFGIAYPIWLAFFRPKSESQIVSAVVQGQSQTIIEKIKIMMLDNELLNELVPKSKLKDFEFSKTRMVMSNGSKIYLAPYSANVRGTHVDYLFGDEVATYKDKQDDYIIWFRDFMSRVEGKGGQVAAVSTPIEPGDLITLLLKKKGWFSKIYAALLDKDGKPATAPYTKETAFPIWADRVPAPHDFETLMRIREEQGHEVFERNYQCDPTAAVAKAIYSSKDITAGYDEEIDYTHKTQGGMIFIGGDFAMSDHKDADKDAYVVIEKLPDKILIKHMEINPGGTPFEEKVNRLDELSKLHQPYQLRLDNSNVGQYVTRDLLARGWPAIGNPFGAKSRNTYLSTLKIVIGDRKLTIPYNKDNFDTIKLAEELTLQLVGFKEVKSEKGFTTYKSTAPHDDLAMALALAISGAEEQDLTVSGFSSGNF